MQVNKRNPMAKIVKTLQIWRALIWTRKMQPETWNLKLGEKAGNLKNKQNFRNGRRLEPTATNLQTGEKIFFTFH